MEVLVPVAEASNGMSIWMPKKTWQAGETATGKVKICLKSRTTVRAVKVKWHGVAHCHWHTGSGKNRSDYSKAIDVIPETISTLFEPQGDHHFEGGQHYEYPFSVVIPKNVPPAFEYHDNTYIRYQLKGYVDIPNWPDHEVQHNLQVLSGPEHLTAVPASAKEPITKADTQIVHTCCCCGKAGMADLSLNVSSGVLYFDEFAPQGITATVSLKNDSTRTFSGIALHLHRVVELKTSWSSHVEGQTVHTEALKDALAPQEALTNKQVMLRPAVKPTASVAQEGNTVHVPSFSTDVIVVSYVVILKASNGCASDPQVEIPLSVVPADRSLYAQQAVPMMLPSNISGMPYAYNPDFPPGAAPASYYPPTQGYYPPQTGYDGSAPLPSAYGQYGAPSAYAPGAPYATGGYPNPSYDAPPKYA